jgi:D-amino peptidase
MNRKLIVFALVIFCVVLWTHGEEARKGLRVFISVDMEGVSGVIHWDDVSETGRDYGLFRRLMTEEANAAIEGALAAGATDILVRDAHDTGRNILPDLLRPEARLIRDWSGGPLSMMEGIDKTFDAVVFIGYHARAGTPDAVLKHTMSLSLFDIVLNGVKMPEAGLNAAIAGYFGVPVVLIAGDAAVVKQAKEILGNVEGVVVKEGIGNAAMMLHPKKSQELIRAKTEEALKRLKEFKPYKPTPPYTLEIVFNDESMAAKVALIPGAVRTSERAVSFTSSDFMQLLKLWRLARS